MNCLEFHRMLRTEPDGRDPEFVGHQAQCESCAREATRAMRFEQRLREAIEVPVPESLTSRVLLRHEFTAGGEGRHTQIGRASCRERV